MAESFEQGIVLAVNHDGDSDSTGAITGNILGAMLGSSVILCAGEKTGKEKRFYDEMIPVADDEFSAHLEELQRGK